MTGQVPTVIALELLLLSNCRRCRRRLAREFVRAGLRFGDGVLLRDSLGVDVGEAHPAVGFADPVWPHLAVRMGGPTLTPIPHCAGRVTLSHAPARRVGAYGSLLVVTSAATDRGRCA